MKYIIMCGGEYEQWETPKQLLKINGEEIVARTIRLLKERGVDDIAISSNNDAFNKFGVPVLKHDNTFRVFTEDSTGEFACSGWWVDAFYPTDEPTTYLFGDVVYSPEAIKTIIETETDDFEFFASAPPYSPLYFKPYQEPFAFKIVNTDHLKQAIKDCKTNAENGMFWRHPISWELWTSLKYGVLRKKRNVYRGTYTAIRDYTCDIDTAEDLLQFERILNGEA